MTESKETTLLLSKHLQFLEETKHLFKFAKCKRKGGRLHHTHTS